MVGAIIMSVAIVNAASVNWNAGLITSSPDKTLTGAGQYSAYFFATSDSSSTLTTTTMSAVLAEIKKGSAGDISSLFSYTANNVFTASTGKGTFSSTGNGDFAAGTSISGFVLILDSLDLATTRNYMIAQTAQGDQILTKTAGTSGSMLFSYGSQANNTWQAIPEPTSGLMILLGMAGLALRRKGA